jgi:hypothetical protein
VNIKSSAGRREFRLLDRAHLQSHRRIKENRVTQEVGYNMLQADRGKLLHERAGAAFGSHVRETHPILEPARRTYR